MIPVEIADADIDEIAAFMGRNFDAADCRQILKARETLDVQAAPGSGKTTLLVAKLALLGARWSHARQGICVLSHTNVARVEVETRLHLHPAGRALLSYPHFIGTIQTFAHQYLALPYLRGLGITLRSVDDARFTAAARRLVKLNSFWHARKYLERNPNRAEGILSSLTLSGADLDLTCGESLPSETTDTFKSFHNLKWRLARDGVFRFADMFAFAQRALREVPGIAEAVSSRFPVVFFDEMQDTGALQEALAEAAFGNRSTIQRFGDCNQGIFDSSDHAEAPNSFPVEDAVDLSHSRRFGPFIAAAASTLTVVRAQKIVGNTDRAEKRHAIFLFDRSCVDRVLPAFGDHVLAEFPAPLAYGFVAKAVALRKKGEGASWPRHLGDYWPDFDATQTSRSNGLNTLIGYVRRARAVLTEDGALHAAAPIIWEGVTALLHNHACELPTGESIGKKSVLRALDETVPDASARLLAAVHECCLGPPLVEANWKTIVQNLVTSLTPLISTASAADDFLIWDSEAPAVDDKPTERRNTYEHLGDGRSVAIDLNTIAGVKGETHDATLVLTSSKSKLYDVKEALGPLSGTAAARAKTTIPPQLMNLFVGITRPKSLLCLAVVADHMTEPQKTALIGNGWLIQDLRVLR
ncbi:UvrD-helicase domain-containing protein [Brevundimonas bullata]|uniref:UvrD-helicase domain-containing protein n=1 Tax=Brevundimonas bullata TaxID=13160 RepID=UPI000E0A54B1|nr:UvrD-helicase domain-containing protein [Brevundimonas bullata]WQE37691.1 UvrD-helicase domain-containing protein [Brevundimonas bullata]